MMNRFLIAIVLSLLSTGAYTAQVFESEDYKLRVEQLADGLENPWSVEFLPDGRILVSERPGYLRIISKGEVSRPVSGLPKIKAFGQGGLLDIAIDPDFEKNQTIYLSYSGPGSGGVSTEVISARLVDHSLQDMRVIFTLAKKTSTGYHFGSRILFDRKGKLYISLGDRGDKDRSQDLDDHAGSLIRINKDGSVPDDNPFIGRSDVLPEIYTYGNRNMQGMDLHPDTGDIWTVEHGPQGGDELNLMQAGVNYGWPVITYGVNYVIGTKIGEGTHKEGMAQPVHHWVPSIATSGLMFYSGDKFPAWKSNAFVSSLKFGQLARLELKDNKVVHEERLFDGELGRIRDVKQGPDGYIYMVTDEQNGKLLRVRPDAKP